MNDRPPFIRMETGPIHITAEVNRAYHRWSYRGLRQTQGLRRQIARLVVIGSILEQGGYGCHWPTSPVSYPPLNARN
jgi:hypothetical protein